MTGIVAFNLIALAVVTAYLAVVARRPQASPMPPLLACVLPVAVAARWLAPGGERNFFGLAQLAAWGGFVHLPLALLGGALVLRRRRPRTAVAFAAAGLATIAVAVFAFFIEPARLEVTVVRVAHPSAPARFRIAVVSDFQTDVIGDYERRIVREVQAARPDLVLFTGDYIHAWEPAREALVPRFAELWAGVEAPWGLYAVRGDTEAADWPRLFAGTHVAVLPGTRSFASHGVRLTGLDLDDSRRRDLAVAAAPGFHVVFGHRPDFALGDVRADLLIAGHTHGGQVQLPFLGPLVTFSGVPRAWADGVTALPGRRTLVVSRGLGMERGHAPRLRFLCRPRLVIVEVEPLPDPGDRQRRIEP